MKRGIIVGVANLSRIWLQVAAKNVSIVGHEKLIKALERRSGPLLTISNHISTVDDPLIWGALLENAFISKLLERGQMRWAVGARELTFTNPFTSWFFNHGQIIPIVRGDGIFQPAMSQALQILDTDRWLHFFPEGKVNQYIEQIGRLKWGVGRLLMDCKQNITILPMYLKGFDHMKPNDEIPRLSQNLEIVIGESVDSSEILMSTAHIKNIDIRRSLITQMIQDLLNLTMMGNNKMNT